MKPCFMPGRNKNPISLELGFGHAHAPANTKLQITNHNYFSMAFWPMLCFKMLLLVNMRGRKNTVKFNFFCVANSVRICLLCRPICKTDSHTYSWKQILLKVSKIERNYDLYFTQRPILMPALCVPNASGKRPNSWAVD